MVHLDVVNYTWKLYNGYIIVIADLKFHGIHIMNLGLFSLCLIHVHVYNVPIYSGPSLSGHSQQRPPSLLRPQFFATTTINVFTSPSHQRPPL